MTDDEPMPSDDEIRRATRLTVGVHAALVVLDLALLLFWVPAKGDV